MKLKRIILIIIPIVIVAAVGIIILLSGLGASNDPSSGDNNPSTPSNPGSDPNVPEHTHNWVLQNTIEPTCTSVGYKQFKCSEDLCIETYEEEIEILPHTPQIIDSVEATCYETGLSEGQICSVCETILVEQVETPILEHEYVDNFCIHCNGEYYTPNSYFDLNEDGTGYNYESPYDVDTIVIPNEYNGLPVTSFELDSDLQTSLESIVIGNNITEITSMQFQNFTSLKNIVIGEGVKSIEEFAFSNCSSLTEIIIPDSVTFIGENAFSDCVSLEKVVVGDGVEVLSKGCLYTASEVILGNNVKIIEPYAIAYAEKVSIPNSIEYIAKDNFINISEYGSVTEYNGGYYIGNEGNPFLVLVDTVEITTPTFDIHDNCKIILEEAFESQSNLEKITLSDRITQIGQRAFVGCYNLNELKIGINVKYIDEDILIGAESLKSLHIPSNVINIKHNSFPYATSITVDSANRVYDSRNGCDAIIEKATNTLIAGSSVTYIQDTVEHIGEYAFWECTFSSIKIPESVKTIGNSAFSECDNLYSITIPDSVVEIGHSAFSGCSYLKTIKLGNGLKYIPNNMFISCTYLQNVVIGNSVELIDYSAFESCNMLTEIYLPKSIKTLAPGAFANSSISTINYEGSQEEWESIEKIDAFIGMDEDVEIVYDYILEE